MCQEIGASRSDKTAAPQIGSRGRIEQRPGVIENECDLARGVALRVRHGCW